MLALIKEMSIWPALFVAMVIAIDLYALHYNWGWWRHRSPYEGPWERILVPLFFSSMFNLFALAAAIGSGIGLAHLVGNFAETEWQRGWSAPMASMRNSDGIHGSISGGIFMMSGRVESKEVYYYYTHEGDNAYKPRKWVVDGDTTVFEEDRTDANVVQWYMVFKGGDWMRWFAIPDGSLRMDFHIPKGSIVQQYKLD